MGTPCKLLMAILALLSALAFLLVGLPFVVIGVLWLCGYDITFLSAFCVMAILYLINIMMNLLLMSDEE